MSGSQVLLGSSEVQGSLCKCLGSSGTRFAGGRLTQGQRPFRVSETGIQDTRPRHSCGAPAGCSGLRRAQESAPQQYRGSSMVSAEVGAQRWSEIQDGVEQTAQG